MRIEIRENSAAPLIKIITIAASIIGGMAVGGSLTFLFEVYGGGAFDIALLLFFPVALCLTGLMWRLTRAPRKSSESGTIFGIAAAAASLLVSAGLLLNYFVFSFDTQYAPGYSDAAFQSIKVGDTRQHVIEVLGEPLRIYGEPGRPVLSYSRSPSGSNYMRRDLQLDEQGRVIAIWSEVWWD